MRSMIIKNGQIKTILFITVISVIISELFFFIVSYSLAVTIVLKGILISFIIPLIVTPILSWYLVSLIIKIHHLEVKMRNLATYDSLTNVLSRKAFMTNAEVLYQLNKREQSTLAFLYIDIDDFKKINDKYGHQAGDVVLKSFGEILDKNRRESDIVGRLGGEEFAYVLPETNIQGAMKFSNNLRNIINNQFIEFDNIKIKYTISIGVSICDCNNMVFLDELIRQADEALFIAKHQNKDCVIEYKVK